jgi:hypothetical protein
VLEGNQLHLGKDGIQSNFTVDWNVTMPVSLASLFSTQFSAHTQATRLLRLTTPLGANTLLAECVDGTESLDTGYIATSSSLVRKAAHEIGLFVQNNACSRTNNLYERHCARKRNLSSSIARP